MNLKILNILIFGFVGLIVLGSWVMTIWVIFNILIAFPAMLLASCMCTLSYQRFIVNSLNKQKHILNKENGGIF